MKKHLMIIPVIAMTAGGTVHAATQCVALDDSGNSTCTATGESYAGKLEWAVNCTISNSSIGTRTTNLKGIAKCASGYPGTPGKGIGGSASADMPSSDSGSYCFCKTIYPFVSNWSWSSASTSSDTGNCNDDCANSCVESLTTNNQAHYYMTRKTLFTPSNN